jgi:hypothetical protein
LLYLQCGDPVQILIDAVQELIESHEAAEGGGGGGNGDRGEGERKGEGGGGAERGGDAGCVSQLSFADAAPRSQHLLSSGTGIVPLPGTVPEPVLYCTVLVLPIYFTVSGALHYLFCVLTMSSCISNTY